MATTLYGWDWIGDDEPTTGVLATQRWISPTSGEIYTRDTSNTSWIYSGNVDNRMGGAVEVAGSTMTGSLLDAPNLPPLDNPDFTGTIRQGGFPVALLTALSDLEKRLYDRIAYQVREQFLSQTKRSTLGSTMAFGYGTVDHGGVVPLPRYDDGIQAKIEEIVLLNVAGKFFTKPEGYTYSESYSVDPVTLIVSAVIVGSGPTRYGSVSYIIICSR